jgi:ribosomal protein L11 methylase PrmA
LYRQIQASAADDWQAFLSRGLYAQLVADSLVVEHEDAALELAARPGARHVIQPRRIDFVSYPYEWSFSQLREAALLTLELQARALAVGMRLKDASAFNVQLERGRPVLIDSLSFEVADPVEPWPAYRQFCEHFLAPLALMAYRDARCGLLLRDFVDGIPLNFAARLLPGRTRFNVGLGAHLHLHARAQGRGEAAGGAPARQRRVTLLGQQALLDSLRRTVEKLRWQPRDSEWSDYAATTSYSPAAAAGKRSTVERLVEAAGGTTVWDLGANTGDFSRLAASIGRHVIAFDLDAATVERNWLQLRDAGIRDVLPLVQDLANPSPALGWALAERRSLLQRGPADVAMALALLHHLAIGRNVPLPLISALVARLAGRLILEFVPKQDPMTQGLLAARRDVFPDYSVDGMRAAFAPEWRIIEEAPIEDSLRTLFLMERRSGSTAHS